MKAICTALVVLSVATAGAQQPKPKDLNTLRSFPEINSKAEWNSRAEEIRQHILMSCGLWPMPPKSPLNAKVFDRVERDGYSVEKVYFESYPGFFVAGNLYRPRGQGNGPFPAILNPHGHWSKGRLEDSESGSIAARCINFARQGMIAFAYDMVGYNDTRQVDHKFASHPTNLLWNISLMGLQTWNSIRALDFLESLPDADEKRLACTGASGGGTQTFMLGAIDDRLSVLAPNVMVSHSMQGGCLCENAPGLRVDYSNIEIAAVPAPKPQILVAATGDWTKKTMEIEGPSIASIYRLLGAPERFHYTLLDYPHNYNRASREAVYAWFNQWLLKKPGPVSELPYTKEPDAALRVFPDQLPPGALDETQLIRQLVELYQEQIEQARPRWKRVMSPAWEHALQLQHVRFAAEDSRETSAGLEKVIITREPERTRIALNIRNGRGPVALLLGEQPQVARALESRGITVVTTDACSSGPSEDQFRAYFSTYNRTWVQNGAANIKATAEYLQKRFPRSKLFLIATRESAAPAIFTAPLVSAVVADCSDLNDADDAALLRPNSFFPGLRRIGSFQGALLLASAKPALLHGATDGFRRDWLATRNQDVRSAVATPEQIASFIEGSSR